MAEDLAGGNRVLVTNVRAKLDEPVVKGSGRLHACVQPLVFDADRLGIDVAGADVGALHEAGAATEARQRLMAALHRVAAAADGELLAGITPAIAVHMKVLNAARKRKGGGLRGGRAVGSRRVMNDDVRRLVTSYGERP